MSQRSPFNKRNTPKIADDKPVKTGMARGGASQAKPAREAAGSVRVVHTRKDKIFGTSTVNMTKEEKKALKRKEREEQDTVMALSDMVTKNNPVYRKRRYIWWILLGAGVACIFISFAASYWMSMQGETAYDTSKAIGVVAVVSLVLAYVGIIAGFVWDWTKLRPIRNQTEEEISRMSEKRRAALVVECNAREAERKGKKKGTQAAEAATKTNKKSGSKK